MKKLLARLLVSAMLLTLVSCNLGNGGAGGTTDATTTQTESTTPTPTTTPDPTPEPEPPVILGLEKKSYSILDCLDRVKIHGRGMEVNGGITADWSASGIEFTAECEGSVSISTKCSGLVLFSVFVDGVLQVKPAIFFPGENTTVVASNISNGEHTFLLVRRQMVESGNSGLLAAFTGIEVYGELTEKPADRELLIEFVGDSITCGYGVGDASPADGSNTYAVQAANQLDADYSIVAVSGIGVSLSTDRHASKFVNMSESYDVNNRYRSDAAYVPTRQADVVVINLNTNDNAQVASLADDALLAAEADYKAAARLLLQKIRTAHGDDVKIVWVTGMMSNPNKPDKTRADGWMKEILEELGGEDAGYYTVGMFRDTSADAGHPNEMAHKQNATRLASFIEDTVLSGS